MSQRAPLVREQLDELGRHEAGAERVLAEAEGLPLSERLALVHGDLHVRQSSSRPIYRWTRYSGLRDRVVAISLCAALAGHARA